MKASHNTCKCATLTGLLVAFLLSSVILPAFSASQNAEENNVYHLITDAENHSAPCLPLPLPEEKEEEESRTDKHHTFILTLFNIEFEQQALTQTTTWAFNHTNTAALSACPIYLAQHLLLI